MAEIKNGFDDKLLEINIHGRRNESAEIWIKQHGLPEEGDRMYKYRETLSYASLEELAELKKEIEDAILEITGINR